jgi:hypothetical protein
MVVAHWIVQIAGLCTLAAPRLAHGIGNDPRAYLRVRVDRRGMEIAELAVAVGQEVTSDSGKPRRLSGPPI